MKASVTICMLSVCCWGLAFILYTKMAEWGLWAILGAGLFMWLGAASSIMGIACTIVDATRGMDGETKETAQTD